MPEPKVKDLRDATRGWRPKSEGSNAIWWIIGLILLGLWLSNGGHH